MNIYINPKTKIKIEPLRISPICQPVHQLDRDVNSVESRGPAPACHAMTRILLLQPVLPTPGHHHGNHSNWMAGLALRQAAEVISTDRNTTKTLGPGCDRRGKATRKS